MTIEWMSLAAKQKRYFVFQFGDTFQICFYNSVYIGINLIDFDTKWRKICARNAFSLHNWITYQTSDENLFDLIALGGNGRAIESGIERGIGCHRLSHWWAHHCFDRFHRFHQWVWAQAIRKALILMASHIRAGRLASRLQIPSTHQSIAHLFYLKPSPMLCCLVLVPALPTVTSDGC